MRTLQDVLDQFPNARIAGLTDAEVSTAAERFGANRLTPLPREPVWKKFLEKFDEPIIHILLAASLLKIVVDLFTADPLAGAGGLAAVAVFVALSLALRLGDWIPVVLFALAAALVGVSAALGHPSVEGLAVMVAVALATGVAFLSEYRSDREFEALNAGKDAIQVKVVRGGQVRTLPLDAVVVGDLIALEPGDEVPADGRAVRAGDLKIDQSLLTGESEPSKKAVRPDDDAAAGPDSPGCLFRGTQVVDGLGAMVVTNVGDDTMLGQIARKLSDHHDEPAGGDAVGRVQQKLTLSKQLTPLQVKLAHLAGLISKVGYVAAAAIFLALLVRGIYFSTDPSTGLPEVFVPTDRAEAVAVVNHLLDYFVYMVIVIVVAVPEGLPMSVTVSLALAMRKMTRANALVRQLVATETIGSATVICSDKTGTLTRNRMEVERLGVAGEVFQRADPGFEPKPGRGAGPTAADWIALNGAVNSTAALEEKEGNLVVVGSSTEGALLRWLRDAGADYGTLRAEYSPLFRVAFSSDRKTMTTLARVGGKTVALVKGAPEVVAGMCDRVLESDGDARDLGPATRERFRNQIAAAAGDAMRTLAFAHVELPADFPADADGIAARRAEFEAGLTFAGWVAIRDPLRDEVPEAVARCREAGIGVTMITGDNADTARAIARDAGLLDRPDAIILTSDEFGKLSDDDLAERLPRLRVLARAKPLDKLRMVRLLQARGEVVAMTGDGTNDAPSLKAADVGLAMGIAGTEVAKEASKIVLLDDSFATIVKAVHWGRSLYENIQRFLQFQLTINVSALVIAFLGPFLGLKPPFTVLQLLWINVIMDTFAAIALCSEPPRAGLMRVPPKRRNESILTAAMLGNIFITAAFFVVVMIALLKGMEGWGWFLGDGPRSGEFPELTARQVTIFFTVYVFFQVWNQINCRSLTPDASGLRGLGRNPYFLAVASLTVLGQWVIVTFGGEVFAVEPLTARDWLAVSGSTASVLAFAEVSRQIRKAL